MSGGTVVAREATRADGAFEVRNLAQGSYQVSVEDSGGQVIWCGVVPVGPGAPLLVIQRDREPVKEQPGAGTVSVTQLRQKPSPAALRELRLAEKAQHNVPEAIEHLRRAVELAPWMQEARNNLGAKYLVAGNYEAAKRELEAAVALDPDASYPHANLSLALLELGRPSDAEAEARLALRRNPLSPEANFVAGAALKQEGKLDESLRFLDHAGAQLPHSLLLEAQILQAGSRNSEAAAKLRTYLAIPGVAQRDEVKR